MIVIGIRFKRVGKVYYFDPCGLTIKPGQYVIVETARGIECGACVMGNTDIPESQVVSPLKNIIRIATEDDLEIMHSNEQQAHEAYQIARQKIEEHGLEMRLVAVECTFDLNKILFYFSADGRVDFRSLVKDLASIFRTRIELRQIGVRDEAKMIGGLGICGRELCCSSYLDEFQPVSINMAKDQNLSLNPTKISGTCGRLMCCLKYEHDVYTELQKVTPKIDSLVDTPEGRGTVLSTQMLRGTCKVQLESSPDEPKTFSCAECQMLRSGRTRKNCCGECSQSEKTPEIDPMLEQTPDAVADPPPRKKREENPSFPSDEAKSDTSARPTRRDARNLSERPRLVKAAPKPTTEESLASKPQKRHRRRNPTRHRSSSKDSGAEI